MQIHRFHLGATMLRRAGQAAAALAAGALVMFALAAPATAQLTGYASHPSHAGQPPATLAEPIHWKQNLFLIPYQWNTAADPNAAQAVWLYVSRDRGATWQKISEAKPHVKAFNYHAEADGEYWFAIRTVDQSGQPQPPGEMQPELRVVVDTTMPQITELRGTPRPDGQLDIQWAATDQNLDPNSLRIEAQTDASDVWVTVPIVQPAPAAVDTLASRTTWSPPPGSRVKAVRATVSDRAGNPTFFQTEAGASSPGPLAYTPSATLTAEPGNVAVPYPRTDAWDSDPFGRLTSSGAAASAPDDLVPVAPPLGAPTATPPAQPGAGWTSPTAPLPNQSIAVPPPSQPWAADAQAPAPFRLATLGSGSAGPQTDTATTYGNPEVREDRYTADHYRQPRDLVPADLVNTPSTENAESNAGQGPNYQALEPFRQASIGRAAEEPLAPRQLDAAWSEGSASLYERWGTEAPRGVEPRLVNSRNFSLEYQVDDVGGWGVSKVQLWGTRDGGQTWHYYAEDDDNRSPLNVTVDGEGLYGFRIVVQSAAGPGGFPPQSGDAPELWVGVDLNRPRAELVSVEPGIGNQRDHLILEWRADDDNLESRPISLFYSSRPTGPWSAAATGLQNTGEYAWRLERYVPEKFYLRLEVRDTAGNLAAFQTVEPIRLDRPEPSGSLRAVEPVDPTATTPTMPPR